MKKQAVDGGGQGADEARAGSGSTELPGVLGNDFAADDGNFSGRNGHDFYSILTLIVQDRKSCVNSLAAGQSVIIGKFLLLACVSG